MVTVAQRDSFNVFQVYLQLAGILRQQVALAGVEQQAVPSCLDMESQSVFRQQAAGMDAILNQSGDRD